MRLSAPTIGRYINQFYKCNKNNNDYYYTKYICEMITTQETKFTFKMVFSGDFVNCLSKPIPLPFFPPNSSSYSLEE